MLLRSARAKCGYMIHVIRVDKDAQIENELVESLNSGERVSSRACAMRVYMYYISMKSKVKMD